VDPGTIEVFATYPSLAVFYSGIGVNIEIDGNLSKHDWGSYSFEVPPGTHEVAVSYPWIFKPKAGRQKVTVELGSGEVVRVTYCARFVRYMRGTMTTEKVSSPRAAP
jgi:hypothetical protein